MNKDGYNEQKIIFHNPPMSESLAQIIVPDNQEFTDEVLESLAKIRARSLSAEIKSVEDL